MRRFLTLLVTLLVFGAGTALGQGKQVSGVVTSAEDKQPVPGVNVFIKEVPTVGVTTDANGRFLIKNLPPKAKTLVFRFVGFQTTEKSISGEVVNVALLAETQKIDEVVVVGYGVVKKKDLGGAVASVSSKSLQQIPTASIDNILQGKATGVQITAVNGRPGQTAYVRVRGVGSINASSQPLYVIDGVPAGADNFNALNANDIESVSILKDAASASIYGSRGSNGVVVIQTKRGKQNQSTISYSFQYGIKQKTKDALDDMMTAGEKLRYEYDLGFANPDAAFLVDELYPGKDLFSITDDQRNGIWNNLEKRETDWQKVLLRDGIIKSHEVKLSGGTETFKYYSSLSTYDEEGISKGSDFNRKTGRLNVDYKVNEWFKIGNAFTVSYSKEDVLRDRFNPQNPFYCIYGYNPYEKEYNEDGSYNLTHTGLSISEAIKNNPETANKLVGLGSIYGEVNFLNDFTLKSTLGFNLVDYKREYYMQPYSVLDDYVGDKTARGSKTDNGWREYNQVWTNQLMWRKSFDKHSVDASIFSEFTEDNFSSYSLSSKGYPTPSVNTQNNGATPTAATSAKEDWSLFSLFAQANYNYDSKYYFSGTVRRDGSSRFGKDNRFGNFWGAGFSWVANKESFLENVSQLNLLKFRISAGTSGNFTIGNYASLGLYALNVSYNGQPASAPSQLANPNLTWEKNFNYGCGVDFEMFDSRLTGTIDFYSKTTKDLLLDVPRSETTGFAIRKENIGEMENKGIEVKLGYDIIRTKDLVWNLGASYSYNKNEITKLYGGKEIISDITRIAEGEPINTYFLTRYVGVDSNNGDALFLDKTGKQTNAYSANDAVLLKGKTPDPTWFGNFTTSVSYKDLSLAAEVYYSGGNFIFNNMYQVVSSDGENISDNQHRDALDYWKKPGDKSLNPKPSGITFNSDRYLQSGDYWRLKSLTISYSLPKNIISKVKMQNLRVYLQGQNLYTSTKFKGDPEVGIGSGESYNVRPGIGNLFSYPQTRAFTFGVDVTF